MKVLVLLILLVIALGSKAQVRLIDATATSSTTVSLTWTTENNRPGWFRIFRGVSPGNYIAASDTDDVRQTTIRNLTSGIWYFQIMWFISGGNQNFRSNEISVALNVPTPSPSPSPPPSVSYQEWRNKLAEWIRNHPPVPDQ